VFSDLESDIAVGTSEQTQDVEPTDTKPSEAVAGILLIN
jgi:hypothetical protein